MHLHTEDLQETDVELRHSYLAKSAIRSTRMIDSICSQLINNVPNVESATGYENDTDDTDEEGRPPHSVEIIVDGGDETSIASIILDKKLLAFRLLVLLLLMLQQSMEIPFL